MKSRETQIYSFNIKNALFFLVAIIIMLIIYKLPCPPSLYKETEEIVLSPEGKAVFSVLCYAVILWLTEAIPFAITALSIWIILPLMGVGSFKEVMSLGLGNDAVVFLMSAIGIAGALTVSGLAHRFMLIVLSNVGIRTDRIIFGFMALATMLSMWVTDMAVAAMMLPLGVSVLNSAGCKPLQSNFGRALMIGIVWGCLIGGITTPAGCGPNILAISFARDLAGITVTFPMWMAVGIPAALIMLPFGWFVLMKMFPPEMREVPMKLEQITKELKSLGPLSLREKRTLIIFSVTVSLWLSSPLLKKIGLNLPIAAIALMGFLLCFLPGLKVFKHFKEAEEQITWGPLLLIAGGISAGLLLAKTGAARYIAWAALSGLKGFHPLLRVMAVIMLVESLKIFFSSNSVTGAVVIPLVIVLAIDLGMNPWVIAGPAAIANSLGFIMVTSSPTNVIPYSSGYFRIPEFAKAGIFMTAIAVISITISVAIFGRFVGMNIWG